MTCCLLTESVNTAVFVDEQRMFRPDSTDAYADLGLRCSFMKKGLFRT